jgi:hypothetical protein
MSLQELTDQADLVRQALEPDTPETEACLGIMRDAIKVLNDVKKECAYHISTRSDRDQFERLERIVLTIQYVIGKIIEVLGEPDSHSECITDAADLIGALGIHILLIQNAESLMAKAVPAQDALTALGPSLKDIRSLIATFHSSVDKLYKRYERENR